jgi:replication factor C small subunit
LKKTGENSLWVEKYRPKTLNTYIGNSHIKTKVKGYLESGDPPHLLFYGRAGTGKTTVAKIISENINCDKLYINASDETSVDTIRNKVKSFASSVGFSPLKIIILDEFDYMTPNAQAALRNLMETYSQTTRFILTCNFYEKIIDPIISRCQTFHVYPPEKKEIAVHLAMILNQENIQYDLQDVATVINAGYPDIRRIINSAQRNTVDKKFSINQEMIIESDFKSKLVYMLKENVNKKTMFENVRLFLSENKVSEFGDVYQYFFHSADEISPNNVANFVLLLNEAQDLDSRVLDKELNFMSFLIKIIQLIREN